LLFALIGGNLKMTKMKMSLPKIFTRKSFLLLVLFLLAISLFLPKIVAAMYTPGPGGGGGQEALDEYKQALEEEGVNLQQFTIYTLEYTMRAGEKFLSGKPVLTGEAQAQGGAIGVTGRLVVGMITTPPASSIDYLADISQNLGLAKPAYAQGIGWYGLSPILALWKTFRNITYLAFVIIFIIIGFMIMFRTKIDPQTVISVQQALPRIVVALIIITFSYAIAGLIVDLGQLSTRIVGNLFAGDYIAVAANEARTSEKLTALLNANIFQLVNPLRNPDELILHLGEWTEDVAFNIPGVGITVKLILLIAGFFIMFKIFFALLGPYIAIVLSVIFAPFQLLLGALPGSNAVGGWLKNLIANVLVFPAAFAMLALAAVIKNDPRLQQSPPSPALIGGGAADWSTKPFPSTGFWSPAAIGNWGNVIGPLISFGILFTIPKVVEMIQQALQIKPSPWAGVAGEEIKAAARRLPIIGGFVG